jgi:hypothetical protein
MVSVGTKQLLVHVVEVFFPVTKSLPRAPLDLPQRLVKKVNGCRLQNLFWDEGFTLDQS